MPNEAEFLSPLGEKALLFRRLHASEELGRLPEYRVELLRLSGSTPIKASELLGKSVNVRVELATNKFRYLNGIVTRFEHGGAVGRFDIYHLEMRPWLWHLTLGADCRIFQDKKVTEILDFVFNEYGSSSQIDKRLKGTFRKRPFTVQYRESDFAFVSRLMEEEGIYYYFKHEKDKHTLVLCNGPSGHVAIEGDTLGWAAKQLGDHLREDVVTQWSRAHSLRSLKYVHTDVAPDLPTADLQGSAARSASYPKPNDLEVFDYPGGYEDLAMDGQSGVKRAEGDRLAQLRVDAFESGHVVATGLTPYRHMAAGVTFGFADHQDAGGYLVTRSVYEMQYSGYEANADTVAFDFDCRFTAVPKEVRFQPQPICVRPTVLGPQTATVVGPSGDEIHTDKYGRVKLQFHWDRIGKKNEKSSCYVRVSHPWASKQFGMIALPRIGDEVVVEFLEGNPDRPLVTGRVYNGDNMPPYELPAQQTVSGIKSRSSKGGGLSNANELRFDDNKGNEYVWFQAEKDFHRDVKMDATDAIGQHNQIDIKKNNTVNIGEAFALTVGKDTSVSIGGDASAKVAGDINLASDAALNLKTGAAVAVKGGAELAATCAAAMDLNAGAGLNLTAALAMQIKASTGITIDGGMKLSIKAGSGWITLGPEGVSMGGPIVKINSGGTGSAASAAKKANPTPPKAPAKIKEKKDPLAK